MIIIANYIDKNQDKICQMANDFMRDLAECGVPILETTNNGLNITTPHCYITFVTDLHVLRGRRFDMIFGAVPENVMRCCLKEPNKPRLEYYILDYVLEKEGM